jgi:hypothetical protein
MIIIFYFQFISILYIYAHAFLRRHEKIPRAASFSSFSSSHHAIAATVKDENTVTLGGREERNDKAVIIRGSSSSHTNVQYEYDHSEDEEENEADEDNEHGGGENDAEDNEDDGDNEEAAKDDDDEEEEREEAPAITQPDTTDMMRQTTALLENVQAHDLSNEGLENGGDRGDCGTNSEVMNPPGYDSSRTPITETTNAPKSHRSAETEDTIAVPNTSIRHSRSYTSQRQSVYGSILRFLHRYDQVPLGSWNATCIQGMHKVVRRQRNTRNRNEHDQRMMEKKGLLRIISLGMSICWMNSSHAHAHAK